MAGAVVEPDEAADDDGVMLVRRDAVPLTGPVANDPVIVPELKPARPPMAEPMSSEPLPVTPLTALEEKEFVIVPPLRPTRPPAKVLTPPAMLPPVELELAMLAPA